MQAKTAVGKFILIICLGQLAMPQLLTEVRGVRIVPVAGPVSVLFKRKERAVVVLDIEAERYYIASSAHGIRFDAVRGAYRYEPGQEPTFAFNGRGAEECPELVAALVRMGLAKRENPLIQSTVRGSHWFFAHPDQLPAFVKLALLDQVDYPSKFMELVKLAVWNTMGPPKTDFIVVGVDSVPPTVAPDFIFRNGLAFIVLNPLSPRTPDAARTFYGEVYQVMAVEAEYEFGFYFGLDSSWCDDPMVYVELDGTNLQYPLPKAGLSCADLVSAINGGPMVLYGTNGPKKPGDCLRSIRCKKTGRYAAIELKAIALPGDNLPTDMATTWQLFFKRSGLWTGPGPFLGGAIRIEALGSGHFFTRNMKQGTTYGELYDAVFGLCACVQLYDPDPVQRIDPIRSNTLIALPLPAPEAVKEVRISLHCKDNGIDMQTILNRFSSVQRRQQPPGLGIVVDHTKLGLVAPQCIQTPGKYNHRIFAAGIYAAVGVADDVPLDNEKAFESIMLARLGGLTGSSDTDVKRLKETISLVRWFLKKGNHQSSKTCFNHRFCPFIDRRECHLFSTGTDKPIADMIKGEFGERSRLRRYSACSLCNRASMAGPIPKLRKDRKIGAVMGGRPNREIMNCRYCPYLMCATCYVSNKRCFGCNRRPITNGSTPIKDTDIALPVFVRTPGRRSSECSVLYLECYFDGILTEVLPGELMNWILTKDTVKLQGFEQVFPLFGGSVWIKTSVFSSDFISTQKWRSFVDAVRAVPPSITSWGAQKRKRSYDA